MFKASLFTLCFIVVFCISASSQIVGISAGFHIEGNAEANNPNIGIDDWYKFSYGGLNIGLGVLDSTGAAAIKRSILTKHAAGQLQDRFTKRMAFPNYTVKNGTLWIDAFYGRDDQLKTQNTERTTFRGNSSKNCDNPMTQWQGGSGNLGSDANDLVDVHAHVRRAGSNINNDMHVLGGVAYVDPGGTHYFDFEFYQSEIGFVDPPIGGTANFTNSGPNEGHTAWVFEKKQRTSAVKVIKPGDIDISITYDQGGVATFTAWIWVSRGVRDTVKPFAFSFDPAAPIECSSVSSNYGYAKIIIPPTAIKYSLNYSTIKGPYWGTVGSNTNPIDTNYFAKEFFEFGLNFTQIGIDPGRAVGADPCAPPFKKLLVKSRVGNGFTADLKDFTGPYDITNIPNGNLNVKSNDSLCLGRDTISISANNTNPFGAFHWVNLSGGDSTANIIGNPDSSTVLINGTGVFVVRYALYTSCWIVANDTIIILPKSNCLVLPNNSFELQIKNSPGGQYLSWGNAGGMPEEFSIQWSSDGQHFSDLARVGKNVFHYFQKAALNSKRFYRIAARLADGSKQYSNVVFIDPEATINRLTKTRLSPELLFETNELQKNYELELFDITGTRLFSTKFKSMSYINKIFVPGFISPQPVIYRIRSSTNTFTGKLRWD